MLLLDLSTLRAATGDFAESEMLGKGGFGMVYKVQVHTVDISHIFVDYIFWMIKYVYLDRVCYLKVKKLRLKGFVRVLDKELKS